MIFLPFLPDSYFQRLLFIPSWDELYGYSSIFSFCFQPVFLELGNLSDSQGGIFHNVRNQHTARLPIASSLELFTAKQLQNPIIQIKHAFQRQHSRPQQRRLLFQAGYPKNMARRMNRPQRFLQDRRQLVLKQMRI